VQTVGERELSDVFFEFLEVLRRSEKRHSQKEKAYREGAAHIFHCNVQVTALTWEL
jgi:hypothetical protein